MISRNLLFMSLITLLSCGTSSDNTHTKQYEKDISISQAQRYFHEQELGEDKVDTHDNHPYITAFLGKRNLSNHASRASASYAFNGGDVH